MNEYGKQAKAVSFSFLGRWSRSNSAFLNAPLHEDIEGDKSTAMFDNAKRAQAGNRMGVATS